MKKIVILLVLVQFFVQAQPTHYQWHAEFFSDWYGTGVTTASQTLGGINFEYSTAQAVSANNNFVIEWDNGYNRWNNGTVPFNSIFTLFWHSDANTNNPGDATLVSNTTSSKFYTFRIQGLAYSNRSAILMETSSTPINISSVSDNNSGSGTDVTVSITTSGTPPAEQNIFVRYTTNSWTSWSIVQASGSGTSWTATIPASGNTGPTTSNQYYVFTSTVSLATEQGYSASSDIDLSTISYNNNGGGNFPLPVELTAFSASVKNKSVNLVWHTATEVNNYGFEIEKRQSSIANSQWSKVGFVNGNGNSNSANEYSYTDKTATSGKYSYRLKQIDNDGKYEYSKEVEVDLGKPSTFALNQNYPNPFNPSTSIQYSVVGSQYVSLKVFNVLGKEIAVLVNEKQEPGTYTVDFNSANLSGGAYFYRLQAGEFVQTKKMILLK